MNVCVVSGFVQLPSHPRKVEEYQALGAKLMKALNEVGADNIFAFPAYEECWLAKFLTSREKAGYPLPMHSRGDNPQKNTMPFHVVQHQKTEWLANAAQLEKDTDTFVWMDYGIMHQPGVTAAVIQEFLPKIVKDDFAIPGCWDQYYRTIQAVNWRFCGSLIIVPRQFCHDFDVAVKMVTKERIRTTGHVTWEVNDWARVEHSTPLPIRWYKGDHNEQQFTGYNPADAVVSNSRKVRHR